MKIFRFEATQFIARPREQVFEFFSDATNLESITPTWLRFRVVTPAPIRMREGTLIDYQLRIRGFPLRWRTRIRTWQPPHRFADEQLRGPYRLWQHEHEFEETDGGTLMRDRVRYAPLGGAVVNRLFVERDVKSIFAYRRTRLAELFGPRPAR